MFPLNGIAPAQRLAQVALTPSKTSPAEASTHPPLPIDRMESVTRLAHVQAYQPAPQAEVAAPQVQVTPSPVKAALPLAEFQGNIARPNAWGSLFMEDNSLRDITAASGAVQTYSERVRAGLQQKVREVAHQHHPQSDHRQRQQGRKAPHSRGPLAQPQSLRPAGVTLHGPRGSRAEGEIVKSTQADQ